jgi:hypothetical protein
MRQFTISAVAVTAFAALLASAPAQADSLNGAAAKNGNQCFTFSPTSGSRDARWGYWGACPQTASAPVAPAPQQIRRHRRAASR